MTATRQRNLSAGVRRGTLIVLPMPTEFTERQRALSRNGRFGGLGRWWRHRRARGLRAWVIILLILVTVPAAYLLPPPRPERAVVAALPYWNLNGSAATVFQHADTFTHVSPWMYGVGPGGVVVPQVSRIRPDAPAIQRLRRMGVPLMPTVANARNGRWEYDNVREVLHNPAVRDAHIRSLVALVVSEDYLGIDIDYEDLHASDRAAFTDFITQLADALHERRRLLSVALFAKPNDAGYDQRNVAQDYAALGRVVDEVRLMAYDRHWATSEPGPVAPVRWVRSVLEYAVSQIPREKILLGIPLYGYDWVGNEGTPVSWLQVYGRARAHAADPVWDMRSQSPRLEYRDDDGRLHEVWFENSYSAAAKFRLVNKFDVGGVFFWVLGDEDTRTWSTLTGELKPIDSSTHDGS